jgi:uncharacterized membrane protein YphA (DoxX/SURF4 family)
MKSIHNTLATIDVQATDWLARNSISLLRVCLGIIFFWFGVLKFFPGLSPAQDLALRTIDMMTFGLLPPDVAIFTLASWECVIGLGLIFGIYLRATLILLLMQMMGTITPLFFFPAEVFTHGVYALTLEGQYIVKNMVLVTAALVIGSTVRGGGIVADPMRLHTLRSAAPQAHIVKQAA